MGGLLFIPATNTSKINSQKIEWKQVDNFVSFNWRKFVRLNERIYNSLILSDLYTFF